MRRKLLLSLGFLFAFVALHAQDITMTGGKMTLRDAFELIERQSGKHIAYNEGVLNETEAEMLHNMFKFSDLMAKQVMIPRTDMVCIPNDITYEELNKVALENQYTRYPVYEEDIDKILGFIHVKDLYSLAMKKEEFSVEKLIRPLMLVPETMTLDNLIIEFQKLHCQIAVVIDEFGGTSGLITLEDVLEEIIGEVQDEFDEEA